MGQSGVGSPVSLSGTCPAYLSGIVPGKQQPIVPRQGLGNAARGALRDRLCCGGHRAPGVLLRGRGVQGPGCPPSPAGSGCGSSGVPGAGALTQGSSWFLSRPRHELLSRFRPAALAVTQPQRGSRGPGARHPFQRGQPRAPAALVAGHCGSDGPAVLLGPRRGTAEGWGSGAVLRAPLLGKGQGLEAGQRAAPGSPVP